MTSFIENGTWEVQNNASDNLTWGNHRRTEIQHWSLEDIRLAYSQIKIREEELLERN